MGLFEVRAEVEREKAAQGKAAKGQSHKLADLSAFLVEAWSTLHPRATELLFKEMAPKHQALGLALARLADAQNSFSNSATESEQALVAEDAALVAPLLAAQLSNPAEAEQAATFLGKLGAKQATPMLQRLVEITKQPDTRNAALLALAQGGDGEAVAFAATKVSAQTPFAVVAALARRGVTKLVGRCREQLTPDTFMTPHHPNTAASFVRAMAVLGTLRDTRALKALHRSLDTPYAFEALLALGSIAHASSRAIMEQLLEQLRGESNRTLPYRLGARAVLHALGGERPLDEAREVLTDHRLDRYELRGPMLALAAQVLLHGGRQDVRAVQRLVTSEHATVRAVALAGWQGPALRYYDPAAADRAVRHQTADEVLGLIAAKTSVFRHRLIISLAKKPALSSAVKAVLVEQALKALESMPNRRAYSVSTEQVGADAFGWLKALENLADKKLLKRLARSRSAYVQCFVVKSREYKWWQPASTKARLRVTVRAAAADHVTSLAVLPGEAFLSCGWEGRALRFERSFKPPRTLFEREGARLNTLRATPNGAHVLFCADRTEVLCLDVQTGATRGRYSNGAAQTLGLSSDGTQVAVGHLGGHVQVLSVPALEPLARIEGTVEVTGLAGVPGGGWRIATDDGRVHQTDAKGKRRWSSAVLGLDLLDVSTVERANRRPHVVPHGVGGRWLVSAGRAVRMYQDDETLERRWLFDASDDDGVAISPPETMMAISTGESVVIVELASGETLAEFRPDYPHADELTAVAWRGPAELLVGTQRNGVLHLTLQGAR